MALLVIFSMVIVKEKHYKCLLMSNCITSMRLSRTIPHISGFFFLVTTDVAAKFSLLGAYADESFSEK